MQIYPEDSERTEQEFNEALAADNQVQVIDNISGNNLPPILADLTRIKQVILNLLTNGLKYNRSGGSLTVDAEPISEEMMRISITDTGYGIKESLQSQVFDAFNRLGRESLDVEGTGIGLTISKRLVGLMHGHIDFKSDINSGSKFWIDLPMADINDKTDKINIENIDQLNFNQKINNGSRKYHLLYIEDNVTNAELMTSIFEGMSNIELTNTIDAESGLKLVSADLPDLILMDIQLPGMNGIEALAKLKQSTKTRNIPVIAISASAMKSDLNKAKHAGFYDYLTKPIDINKTLEIIAGALNVNRVSS